ncbi:MAG: hypothetical protein GEU95_01710 [Rhizobiales bacterium]|nr:hypothetical protein [Hyphomicrobiales bacterium]
MAMTEEQRSAINGLALALMVIPAGDRPAAIALMVTEYRRRAAEEAPDLSPEKIAAAAGRFGSLVMRRFERLVALGGEGGHG